MDDYLKNVCNFTLKTKDKFFSKFKAWRTLIENQTGCKIKFLRIANVLEFCNFEFDSICEEIGIIRYKIIPGTPQQNGLVESMNRKFFDKLRCMLSKSKFLKKFWVKTKQIATYLIIKTPHMQLSLKHLKKYGQKSL